MDDRIFLPNGGIHEVKTSDKSYGELTGADPTTALTETEAGFVTSDEYGNVLMGNPEAGDPSPDMALGEGMIPLPEGTDVKLIAAVVDVLSRASCTDFEVAFDDEKPADQAWSAHCNLRGGEDAVVRNWSSADEAAIRLARKVLNGSRCASCAKIMTLTQVNDLTVSDRIKDKYCAWSLDGTQFVRGCIDTHAEMQATEEAFAQVEEA